MTTFINIWREAAKNPNDPRHELAKEMLRRYGEYCEENTEHDPIDEEYEKQHIDIQSMPPEKFGAVHKLWQ